jgi:hypothetical protein
MLWAYSSIVPATDVDWAYLEVYKPMSDGSLRLKMLFKVIERLPMVQQPDQSLVHKDLSRGLVMELSPSDG